MSHGEEISGISQDPVNILFNPSVISKKDVWQINIVEILKMLIKILEATGKKDLKVAGMAALSSSLIYRMKVESIFALQKAAMEKKPLINRRDVDIDILDMPYRHESTYPVSLDELLDLLENLIGAIANPRSRRKGQLDFEADPPDFKEYFVSFENLVEEYESLIIRKIGSAGNILLKEIVADLDSLDSIRCFFTVLFLARKPSVEYVLNLIPELIITFSTSLADSSLARSAIHLHFGSILKNEKLKKYCSLSVASNVYSDFSSNTQS